ncbi:MAG: nitrate- and nitrite sensing domain-containing protein, partial [Lentisphaeraceae bacterium]|nr:nitrate- and nitrite sensing domain-containing protein [Lentisphaeraceae bacterium]
MSKKTKMLLATLTPVVIALVFIILKISKMQVEKSNMHDVTVLVQLSEKIGNLVHNLQGERGMSAGYLSSGGVNFKDTLDEQRDKVDQEFQALNNYIGTVDLKEIDKSLESEVTRLSVKVKQLQDELRAKIKTQKVQAKEAVDFITKINSEYLDLIRAKTKLNQNTKSLKSMLALVYFMQVKENTGTERALVTNVLNSGKMDLSSYQRFNQLVTLQKSFMDTFEKTASKEIVDSVRNKIKSSPDAQKAYKIRQHIFDAYAANSAFEYKSQDWYDTITAKIGIYREVEKSLKESAFNIANDIYKADSLYLNILYLIALVCLVTSYFVSRMSFKMLVATQEESEKANKALKQAEEAQNIAEKASSQAEESAREAEEAKAKAEAEASAVEAEEAQNIAEEAKSIAEVAKAEAEIMAAKANSALEGSSTAFITCNRDYEILYVNPATVEMVNENIDQFKKQFPGFCLDSIIGTNIDIFHKNPAHQRSVLNNPSNLPFQADIHVGNLVFTLNISAMKDANGEYVGNSLEWENVTEKNAARAQAASLQSMVESVESNLMICDRDRIITYVNPSVVGLLAKYETKIREEIPSFSSKSMVGRCIDEFHTNPNHQAGLLSNPDHFPYKAEIDLKGIVFGLNSMALRDANGDFVGIAVEWLDNNDRVAYKNEVTGVIDAAKSGDLGKRGDVSAMNDIYKPMLQGINDIIDAIVAPISELKEQLEEVAEGDLTAYVSGDYKGDHELLKKSLNSTLDNLNKIMGQVSSAATQMAQGSGQVSESSQSISQGATQ